MHAQLLVFVSLITISFAANWIGVTDCKGSVNFPTTYYRANVCQPDLSSYWFCQGDVPTLMDCTDSACKEDCQPSAANTTCGEWEVAYSCHDEMEDIQQGWYQQTTYLHSTCSENKISEVNYIQQGCLEADDSSYSNSYCDDSNILYLSTKCNAHCAHCSYNPVNMDCDKSSKPAHSYACPSA